MATPSLPTKKSIPLSIISKAFRLLFNLLLIGFLAWLLLLFLSTLGILAWGWQQVEEIFQAALLAMTPHLWASHLGLGLETVRHHASVNAGLIFLLVTQFVLERCQVFAIGLSVIAAFAALGFIDGLVKRDLRKFNNARESTLFFHRSKHLLTTVFFTGYFLFIAVPLEMNLTLCLTLMGIVTGYIVQVSVRQFKKHF